MSPFSRGDEMDDLCTAVASDSDMDDTFDEDMEALRRACMITGKTPVDAVESDPDSDGQSSELDEMRILRNIQERFSIPQSEMDSAPVIKPLSAMLLSDSDEDDFETLRAIQRRFQDYHKEDLNKTHTQLSTSGEKFRPEISNKRNNGQMQSSEGAGKDFGASILPSTHSVSVNGYYLLNHEQDGSAPYSSMVATHSHFPRSCQMIVDALKKNRSSQRFIRNMLIHIEGKLGENKDLKERVKHLIDYQKACKRRAALVLSQKKDPRVKLISLPSPTSAKNIRKAKKLGPAENSHVSNYKMVMERFPVAINKQPWSLIDKEKLIKGIKQQYLEMLMLTSMGSESDGLGNLSTLCLPSVGDCDIASEEFRSFLPLINWERLALMYFTGRTGAECQTRWLNYEDPLINNNLWTKLEEKALLAIAQERGVFNWIDIAVRLGTSRTPFQCLMHYQRSLNAYILKKEWTEEEDAQLRTAVEMYGENWQLVASNLEGRNGNQCSNRWRRTLHPDRQRVGRWSVDEDKRLKAAVMLFGPKNWNKIAQFAPGRTQVQCRERWVNCLSPALNLEPWTEEEDMKLKEAIAEFGYCWSKIATILAPRTDNQCRRRWKVLFPNEVPVHQIAWKVKKAALRSNFVDREKERPLIGPNDFCAAEIGISTATSESGHGNGRKKKASVHDQPAKLKRGKTMTKKRKSVMDDQTLLSKENHKKRRKHLKSAEACSNDSNLHIPLSCLTYESSSQVASVSNEIPCLTAGESSALDDQAAVSNNFVRSKQKRRGTQKTKKRLPAESCGAVSNMPPPADAGEPLDLQSGSNHCSELGVTQTVISKDHPNSNKRNKKGTHDHSLHLPVSSEVVEGSNDVSSLTGGESSALAHQAAVSEDPVRSKLKRKEKHQLRKRLLAESCCNMLPPGVVEDSLALVSGLDHCFQLNADETIVSDDQATVSMRRKCTQNHVQHSSGEFPVATTAVSIPSTVTAISTTDLQTNSSEKQTKLNNSSKLKCFESAKEPGVLRGDEPPIPSSMDNTASSLIRSMDNVPSSAHDTDCSVGHTQNGAFEEIVFGCPNDEMKLSEFITFVKKEIKKKRPKL